MGRAGAVTEPRVERSRVSYHLAARSERPRWGPRAAGCVPTRPLGTDAAPFLSSRAAIVVAFESTREAGPTAETKVEPVWQPTSPTAGLALTFFCREDVGSIDQSEAEFSRRFVVPVKNLLALSTCVPLDPPRGTPPVDHARGLSAGEFAVNRSTPTSRRGVGCVTRVRRRFGASSQPPIGPTRPSNLFQEGRIGAGRGSPGWRPPRVPTPPRELRAPVMEPTAVPSRSASSARRWTRA